MKKFKDTGSRVNNACNMVVAEVNKAKRRIKKLMIQNNFLLWQITDISYLIAQEDETLEAILTEIVWQNDQQTHRPVSPGINQDDYFVKAAEAAQQKWLEATNSMFELYLQSSPKTT